MWLLIPTLAALPEPEPLTSESASLAQRLSAAVMSKSTVKQPKYWQRELKRGLLTQRLSSVTLDPSQADSLVAEWLDSLQDSPVPTTQLPVSGPELSVSTGNSGMTSQPLFATWDPIGACWKMSPASLFPIDPAMKGGSYQQGCGLYLATWPRSGSMLNGCVYERPTLALPTVATAGSVLPTSQELSSTGAVWLTPHGMNGQESDGHQGRGGEFAKQVTSWRTPDATRGGGKETPEEVALKGHAIHLKEQVTNWQTPNARIAEDSQTHRSGDRSEELLLTGQAKNWPSPRAEDSESCGNHPDVRDSLTGATKDWPTPDANMNRGSREGHLASDPKAGRDLTTSATVWQTPATDSFRSRGGDRKGEQGLDQQSRFWATPQARDLKNPGSPDGDRASRKAEAGWTTVNDQSVNWGTPTGRDWKDGASPDMRPGRGDNGLVSLQVLNWPTPDANAMNDGESRESWQARADKLKEKGYNGNGAGMPLAIACLDSRSSPPVPAQPKTGRNCWCGSPGCALPSHRPKLNPIFAAWLMGWPLWWPTKEPMPYARWAMVAYLSRCQWLLSNLLGGRKP